MGVEKIIRNLKVNCGAVSNKTKELAGNHVVAVFCLRAKP
jgi:hypothetical protein